MSGGTPTTTTPGLFQTRPIAAATSIAVVIQGIMAAFWAVVGDAGLLPWLTPGTQGLITFAVTATATYVGAYWAARRSTPTASPTLVEGTSIRVVDAGGATLGHTPTPTPLPDPDA